MGTYGREFHDFEDPQREPQVEDNEQHQGEHQQIEALLPPTVQWSTAAVAFAHAVVGAAPLALGFRSPRALLLLWL